MDVAARGIEELGRDIWPLLNLDEDWLLTAVEFLYRNAAKPTRTHGHSYYDCGLHVDAADSDKGRSEFRERMNGILGRYVTPFELRKNGEIWHVAPTGLEDLAVVETGDPSIDERVASAVSRYRRHGSTEEEKRQAVRDLADVLEYLRSSVGTGLPSKDEGYLFDIANNFGIRHHNPKQKTEYNQGVYMDWIFYAFLNAIALAVKVIDRT